MSVEVIRDMVVDEAVVFSSEFEGRAVFGVMLLEEKPVVHREEKIGHSYLGLSGGHQPLEGLVCTG